VRLPLAATYATIGDLALGDAKSKRLLFALLNARIALALLRASLTLRRLRFPADLARITVAPTTGDEHSAFSLPERGDEIFEWARAQELAVCQALDDLGSGSPANVEILDGLHVLRRFSPSSIRLDGELVTERVLVMFDDVERLTSSQRSYLVDEVFSLRGTTSVWLAERMEALSPSELLSSGALEGRDYGAVIYLEQWWRGVQTRFRNAAVKIADKRSRMAADLVGAAAPISSFAGCLQDSLDAGDWDGVFVQAQSRIRDRIVELATRDARFAEWIKVREAVEGTPQELAVAWRSLEIAIAQEVRKRQGSLAFPFTEQQLEKKDDSSKKAAAELFLAREFELPYYFGISRVASLASSNVEQFLELAGNLFEEVLSAALIKRPTDLAPARQEALLREVADRRWTDLPQRLPQGREVQVFLETIGKYCQWETYKPNAPYAPGVTGIAISMKDRAYLAKLGPKEGNPLHRRLTDIISACLAHNLMDAYLDYKVKGGRWMVLNLNRLLCLKFNLPLQYGGFREKQLPVLVGWLERGFTPPEERNGELPL
jgi:hypothetical protein